MGDAVVRIEKSSDKEEEELEVIQARKKIAEFQLIEDSVDEDIHQEEGACSMVISGDDWPKRDDIGEKSKLEFQVLSNAGIKCNDKVRNEREGLSYIGVKSVDTDDEEDSKTDASEHESRIQADHQKSLEFRVFLKKKLIAKRLQNSRAAMIPSLAKADSVSGCNCQMENDGDLPHLCSYLYRKRRFYFGKYFGNQIRPLKKPICACDGEITGVSGSTLLGCGAPKVQ